MKIGILAIQGSVEEHQKALESLGADVQLVKSAEDLENISGIILPGGESTTQSKLLQQYGIFDPLKKKIMEGLPVWGTCAGAILLAKKIQGKNNPKTLEVMDITAHRNWYGAQQESFIDMVDIQFNEQKKCSIEAVFIRAPRLEADSDDIQILTKYKEAPVLLRQNNMLASAFHPELTTDICLHKYFLEMCKKAYQF